MLIFNAYFGSYAQRQLVADYINYNKDVYIDNIEGDFSKYVKKLGRIGWNSLIICILKHYRCLNWALLWCKRFSNKVFTNSIFNWEENKCSLSLMILILIFITISSANIQQLKWHQDKFYLITKINRCLRK